MTPDPPYWGSRGRRFKSGRPDADQKADSKSGVGLLTHLGTKIDGRDAFWRFLSGGQVVAVRMGPDLVNYREVSVLPRSRRAWPASGRAGLSAAPGSPGRPAGNDRRSAGPALSDRVLPCR